VKNSKKYGYAVIDADKIAALVTEKGSPVLLELANAFGEDILNEDGSLNRAELAKRAFKSPEKTTLLNSITHPEITRLILKKVNGAFCDGYEAVLVDASQLFESGFSSNCRFIISVVAPENIRLSRIMERDGISEEAARQRMSAQRDEMFFRKNADVVIENDGDIKKIKDQVLYTARLIEMRISGEEIL
jgi:dephospho-CoA kinase